MADGLNGIIAQLERQKAAIDRALAALRNLEGTETPAAAPPSSGPAKRKGGMTPAGRKRLSAALRKRWAARKAAEGAPAAAPPDTAPRKGGMTPEGRQRLADAMRRRWAVKRTAAQARKRGRKAA
jgi:hypothetical protein